MWGQNLENKPSPPLKTQVKVKLGCNVLHTKVQQALLKLSWISDNSIWHCTFNVPQQLKVVGTCSCLHHAEGARYHFADTEGYSLNLQPTSFYLRKIEDTIDDMQKQVCTFFNRQQTFSLIRGELRLQQQRSQSQNPMYWSPANVQETPQANEVVTIK